MKRKKMKYKSQETNANVYMETRIVMLIFLDCTPKELCNYQKSPPSKSVALHFPKYKYRNFTTKSHLQQSLSFIKGICLSEKINKFIDKCHV